MYFCPDSLKNDGVIVLIFRESVSFCELLLFQLLSDYPFLCCFRVMRDIKADTLTSSQLKPTDSSSIDSSWLLVSDAVRGAVSTAHHLLSCFKRPRTQRLQIVLETFLGSGQEIRFLRTSADLQRI